MPTRAPILRPHGEPERKRYDRERGSAASRGYDRNWQRFRENFLSDHPLCADCENIGRVTLAVEVHHVKKLRHRPDLRLDPENVMALCHSCHSARTARGE
ncbi:MAG: HNH endonuclease [Betaproteobacteria bacterium]|nr:HNH endonuclease [Betaproteobacteria bacterium]